jgi:hypothetical protein
MKPKRACAVVLGGAVWAGACGGNVPPPNDAYAAALADVGRAQAGGAPLVADAKLHLQLAEEDLQKSKQLMDTDNKRATSLVALASVEAQLALSLAKQAAAQDVARKAEGDLQKAGGK